MNKRDEAYVEKMQKRLGCKAENCGSNFVFSVTEFDWEKADWKKKVLKGRCVKCYKDIKLSKTGLHNFSRLLGSPELEIISNNFDDLFETSESKNLDV